MSNKDMQSNNPKEQPKQKVKCPYCSTLFSRREEEFVTHSNRYYHKSCFEKYKQGADDRRELIDYIMELYDLRIPTGMILKQISKYTSEPYNYSLKGIKTTLHYFHEIKGNEVLQDSRVGIGIVEYVYDEALRYYSNLQHLYESNEKATISNQAEKLKIKNTPIKKKKNYIDISQI